MQVREVNVTNDVVKDKHKNEAILCPARDFRREVDPVCRPNCAWFNIDIHTNKRGSCLETPHAYCGNKLIGKVV